MTEASDLSKTSSGGGTVVPTGAKEVVPYLY